MGKVAMITGVNGQDGSYLAELLLDRGYDVHGVIRRTSQFNRGHIDGTRARAIQRGQVFELHYGNMADASSLHRIITLVKPAEIYNLAAQSHVRVSFDEPEYAANIDGLGALRLLEGIRHTGVDSRIYQASTSELYGKVQAVPQNETTPFYPRSPYGVAKLYGFWIVKNYRESYGMHASNGILFNHESPRRGENFVTRKITYSLARIRSGQQDVLRLGNLDAKRDWGFARDYVEAMWLMLQQDVPDDYVIASGEAHTVREFVERAAAVAGFTMVWEGHGIDEVGRDRATGRELVRIDPKYFRPAEVDLLLGDPSKAKKVLGWKPKVKFDELVELMMKADLEQVGHENRSGVE